MKDTPGRRRQKRYHLKMVKRCLIKITGLNGKNPDEFIRMKKKAERHMKKAEAIDLGHQKLEDEAKDDFTMIMNKKA